MNQNQYLRRREAAELLGVSVRTLTDWQRRRIVPFRKIGRAVLFHPNELDEALSRFRVAAVGEPSPKKPARRGPKAA